jgi:putative oxidoreductase
VTRGRQALAGLCRLGLGSVFLVAGLAKAGRPPLELSEALAGYQLLPPSWGMPLALLLPGVEIALGLALWLGWSLRLAALGSVLLSAAFGVFVTSALVRGLAVDCGCLPGLGTVSWGHLALDLILLLMSCALLWSGGGRWALQNATPLQSNRVGRALVWGLLGLACLLPPGLAVRQHGLPTRGGPPGLRLVFEPQRLELGQVPPGSPVTRTVSYRNTGGEPIYITWAQSSCSCTVAQPEKRALAPGEAGQLSVSYRPGAPGEAIRQSVKLYQRGNPQPVVLEVTGQVSPAELPAPGR